MARDRERFEAWTRTCSKATGGKEGTRGGRERRGRDFWSTQCFLPASKQKPSYANWRRSSPKLACEKSMSKTPKKTTKRQYEGGREEGGERFARSFLKGFNVMRDSLTL